MSKKKETVRKVQAAKREAYEGLLKFSENETMFRKKMQSVREGEYVKQS